jgi:hypothetical protein
MAEKKRRAKKQNRSRRTSAEQAFLRRPSTTGGVVEGGVSADEGVIGQIHLAQRDEPITLPSRELRDEERTTPLEIQPESERQAGSTEP